MVREDEHSSTPDEPTYTPTRPKTGFNVKWFGIGLIVMLGLRSTVQGYIEYSTARMRGAEAKVKTLGDLPPAEKEKLDAAQKKVEDLENAVREAENKPELDPQAQQDLEKKREELGKARTEHTELAGKLVESKVAEGGEVASDFLKGGLNLVAAYMIFAPFCYFLGGVLIGWRSPGNTIIEPALAAIVTVGAVTAFDLVRGTEVSSACVGCSGVFSFLIALFGGMIGEKIQGPSK